MCMERIVGLVARPDWARAVEVYHRHGLPRIRQEFSECTHGHALAGTDRSGDEDNSAHDRHFRTTVRRGELGGKGAVDEAQRLEVVDWILEHRCGYRVSVQPSSS